MNMHVAIYGTLIGVLSTSNFVCMKLTYYGMNSGEKQKKWNFHHKLVSSGSGSFCTIWLTIQGCEIMQLLRIILTCFNTFLVLSNLPEMDCSTQLTQIVVWVSWSSHVLIRSESSFPLFILFPLTVQCHGGNQFLVEASALGVNHSEATKVCQQRNATLPFRTSSDESVALSCFSAKLHPLANSRWIHLHFWRKTCSSPSMCDIWAIARDFEASNRANDWQTSKRDGFIYVMCEQGM